MKKVVAGLVGVVISALSFTGDVCQFAKPDIAGVTKYTIDEEARKIRYHSTELKKLLEMKPEDSCQVFDIGEGEPLQVIIKRKEGSESRVYLDSDEDGKYDKRSTITIPNKLDIKVFPPLKPKEEKKYLPEERPEEKKKKSSPEEKKKKLFVYDQ